MFIYCPLLSGALCSFRNGFGDEKSALAAGAVWSFHLSFVGVRRAVEVVPKGFLVLVEAAAGDPDQLHTVGVGQMSVEILGILADRLFAVFLFLCFVGLALAAG